MRVPELSLVRLGALKLDSNLDSSQSIESFVNSFEKLANEVHNLTQSYQSEFGKWKTHQYDKDDDLDYK